MVRGALAHTHALAFRGSGASNSTVAGRNDRNTNEEGNRATARGPPVATQVGSLIFLSGLDPKSLEQPDTIYAPGDIAAQTDHVISKLEDYLKSLGCSLDDVAKVTVYIDDMKKWSLFSEVYNRRFANDATRPARTTLQAGGFEDGMCVEFDVVVATTE